MFKKEKIIEELDKKGWSRYKLCKEAHMAQSTLSDILGGKNVSPKTNTLQRIADALNVPINAFFDDTLKVLPSVNVDTVFSGSGKLIKEDINANNIVNLSKEEIELLKNYNKSNDEGKKMILSYSDYVSQNYKNTTDEISATQEEDEFTKSRKQALEARKKAEQYFKEKPHLMPIASHDKEGTFTEEDYKHDMDIMTNDDLWKD